MHPSTKALALVSLLTSIGCSSTSTNASVEDSGSPPAPYADAGSVDVSPNDAASADDASQGLVEVSVEGSLRGKPFVAAGAAAKAFGWLAEGSEARAGLSFVIGDYPSMCTAACSSGASTLFFYLRGNGKAFEPFPVGTYPIAEDSTLGGTGPAPRGTVLTSQLILGCDFAYPEMTTGSVTITASSETSVTGTFVVTSPSNGPLSGTFVVPICPVADSQDCRAGEQSGANSVACTL